MDLIEIVRIRRRLLIKQTVTARETMRSQLPLEVVDLSAVIDRIFGSRQQLQPDGVELQPSQPEHPLQRHRKIPAAFQIFSGKPATEEDCHLDTKQGKRPTSNIQCRMQRQLPSSGLGRSALDAQRFLLSRQLEGRT